MKDKQQQPKDKCITALDKVIADLARAREIGEEIIRLLDAKIEENN